MTSKIFVLISFNTYSIARSIMFSTSVMELLEIGCQFSWPLGPTTWRHSGNDTGKCTHPYRRPVLGKTHLSSFLLVSVGFSVHPHRGLNPEHGKASSTNETVRKMQTLSDTGTFYLVLCCSFSCGFLWFLLGLFSRCFGCGSVRTAHSLHLS